MRFRTFLITGVEVLQSGGEHWQSSAWPAKHWRENTGRWRLYTVAIDSHVSSALANRRYGGPVEGIVIALEIADFSQWPKNSFTVEGKVPSFKTKYRDLWCFAKLDWSEIQTLTLKQQYAAYCETVIEAVNSVQLAKRKPKGFDASSFSIELADTLSNAKVSKLTRSASEQT